MDAPGSRLRGRPERASQSTSASDAGIGAALAEDDLQFAAPLLAESQQLPLDLWRKVAQDRLISRVNAQRGCDEKQTRRQGRDLGAGEIAVALECELLPAAGSRLAIPVEDANADSVVERLQGQVKILVSFDFVHDEAAPAVEHEQVKHAAVAGG